MKIATLASLVLPVALAQNNSAYLTAVLGALTNANLTGLVGVATAIANTTEGMALLGELAQGNKTVFAPDNAAFAAVPSDVSSNTTLLTQILSYHILNNTYTANGTLIAPDHTIARTLLTGGGYTLPGNRSAPVVLSRNATNATSFQINQATSNVSTTGPAVAANLNVYIIDSVLSLPPNISAAATAIVPSLAQLIQQEDLLDSLAASQGITVFAPNDAAVDAISGAVSSLNSTVIEGILANHIINGSVVYSTELTSSNYTSAGGEPFTFISNSSGTYVSSANSTARIVQSDIIIQNGVVHLIDGVLLNTGNDAAAAASAYSSNTAAAATQTEPTGPVTGTSPASTASTSGATAKSSGGASGLLADFNMPVLGVAVGAIGVLLGGGFVFM